jgi:hypothetical protein
MTSRNQLPGLVATHGAHAINATKTYTAPSP